MCMPGSTTSSWQWALFHNRRWPMNSSSCTPWRTQWRAALSRSFQRRSSRPSAMKTPPLTTRSRCSMKMKNMHNARSTRAYSLLTFEFITTRSKHSRSTPRLSKMWSRMTLSWCTKGSRTHHYGKVSLLHPSAQCTTCQIICGRALSVSRRQQPGHLSTIRAINYLNRMKMRFKSIPSRLSTQIKSRRFNLILSISSQEGQTTSRTIPPVKFMSRNSNTSGSLTQIRNLPTKDAMKKHTSS